MAAVTSTARVVERLRAAGCVFAEDEAALLVAAAQTPGQLSALVERRVAGEPLEHVLGWAEFCGLRIAVEPGVFVPRRRTELLAYQVAALAPPAATVVDLCCGSGAVSAAVRALADVAELHAVDVDPAAVRCARRNLPGAGVHLGDLYDALPSHLRGHVDVVAANAPYVPSEFVPLMPPEARLHEPLVALDGGADGLAVLRRVVASAPAWLTPGGVVVVEVSDRQAPALAEAAERAGLDARVVSDPEQEATVVIGTRRATA